MVTLTRRSFLQRGATLVASAWAVPSFIAETARILDTGVRFGTPARAAGRRILVLVQLAGGNDGLNTLVPYTDPAYYSPSTRPNLSVPASSVLPLNGSVGLHPNLARIKARWDARQMAIVQGVSYPNPNRSHFRGTDIWDSAIPDRIEPKGWMGRYLEACGCGRADHLEAVAIGSAQVPPSFWTEMALVPAIASLGSFRYGSIMTPNERADEIRVLRTGINQVEGHPEAEFLRQSLLTAMTDADVLAGAAAAYTPIGNYPANNFGNSMKLAAQLIGADVGTSIFHTLLPGFDTHADQLGQHTSLLATFDQAVDAFLQDIERLGRMADVTIMTFSEFGRRLAQNGSGGSDHGIAAPMLLLGGSLNSGLHGTYPSLTDLSNGDLKMHVDFRSVYQAVLQSWLNVPSSGILGGTFPALDLFGDPCSPRPNVGISVAPAGPDQLNVTVTAGNKPGQSTNRLKTLAFSAATNAVIDAGGQVGVPGNFTVTLGDLPVQTSFAVRRVTPGVAATAPLVVTDECGAWPTFVGGGAAPWGPGSASVGAGPPPAVPSPTATNKPLVYPNGVPPTDLPVSSPAPVTGKKKKKKKKKSPAPAKQVTRQAPGGRGPPPRPAGRPGDARWRLRAPAQRPQQCSWCPHSTGWSRPEPLLIVSMDYWVVQMNYTEVSFRGVSPLVRSKSIGSTSPIRSFLRTRWW